MESHCNLKSLQTFRCNSKFYFGVLHRMDDCDQAAGEGRLTGFPQITVIFND